MGIASKKTLTHRRTKQISDRILRKLHDLERGRKISRIYGVKCHNQPCVLVCLTNLRDQLRIVLTGNNSLDHSQLIQRYFALFDLLLNQLRVSAEREAALRNSVLVELLSTHRRVFKTVDGSMIDSRIVPEQFHEQVIVPAVMVWGNAL